MKLIVAVVVCAVTVWCNDIEVTRDTVDMEWLERMILSNHAQNVDVWATRLIFNSSTFLARGANVVMKAKHWISNAGDVTINLSGLDGAPGMVGEDGGHFIVSAEKMNVNFSIVSNGGWGGRGNPGKNGTAGVEGLAPLDDEGWCWVPNGTFNGSRRFLIFNERSCGEPGTRGGPGFAGGRAGAGAVQRGAFNISASPGNPGRPGVGGRGGPGALTARYLILYVNGSGLNFDPRITYDDVRPPAGASWYCWPGNNAWYQY